MLADLWKSGGENGKKNIYHINDFIPDGNVF